MKHKLKTHTVPTHQRPTRIDRYLVTIGIPLSRTQIRHLIDAGEILVDGGRVKPHYRVRPREEISIHLPAPEAAVLEAEQMPLEIPYEDSYLLVVNKPAGMIVHPAGPVRTGTLVNALLYHSPELANRGGLRPGIVHRLDKDTSGLLVVAKTDRAHRVLSRQLSTREMKRDYRAIVWGSVGVDEGRIEAPIGRHVVDRTRMAVTPLAARHAATRFRVVVRFDVATLLELSLESGRTHQIRVHCAHMGHPVVGDATYGGRGRLASLPIERPLWERATAVRSAAGRQLLHAVRLAFIHPVGGERIRCEVPLPADMEAVLELLGGG